MLFPLPIYFTKSITISIFALSKFSKSSSKKSKFIPNDTLVIECNANAIATFTNCCSPPDNSSY